MSFAPASMSFTTSPKHKNPSALLVIGPAPSAQMPHMSVLHIIPETRATEHFNTSDISRKTLSYAGATERTREQLGTVVLHVGDGEDRHALLNELRETAEQHMVSSTNVRAETSDVTRFSYSVEEEALRAAATECMGRREGREASVNAMQKYPLFLVRIERGEAGPLCTARGVLGLPLTELVRLPWYALGIFINSKVKV